MVVLIAMSVDGFDELGLYASAKPLARIGHNANEHPHVRIFTFESRMMKSGIPRTIPYIGQESFLGCH